ncbi:MAG: energy transducer TonB [Prevotella sp.]|nr:energy transducer TonB [Prevotella sp.]MCM1074519.1 energy transducer TonB [Ruminococcus sp.]
MKRCFLAGVLAAASLGMWADTPASFPGGDEALASYLNANVVYPKAAQENGIEGTVTVLFAVAADGAISNVRVARPLDPDLESEALRLVKGMPAWTPATDSTGKPVKSEASLPVKFRLNQ